MNTVLKVRLSPTPVVDVAPPLLSPQGPCVVIGGCQPNELVTPVVPTAESLFGPRGACVLQQESQMALWVADTGHHRLLGWRHCPTQDGAPADWVIGQIDFAHEGRNAKGPVGANTLNVPTGLCQCGAGLAVADAWNHRVLVWWHAPQGSHVAPDVVLGQADFLQCEANRGGAPQANSLFWPYGVVWDGKQLWVADTGNRRVLMWQGLPQHHGESAVLVLGQSDFAQRDENGGGEANACSMRWPHALTCWRGGLAVADAGNNRIMIWHKSPHENNQPCDALYGQSDMAQIDHNRARYWPDASSLNMPYGLCATRRTLLVADTANSRLLGWDHAAWICGAPAMRVSGQAGFAAKGDNRWQMPMRDSLCWPYAISLGCGELDVPRNLGAQQSRHSIENFAVIADSGNNRVVLWPLADGVA